MVTLDRVRKSAKETVIEKAGTTLENKTIPGDLVIAESVGEGNVTLKNVTVLGSVIVKGGGAKAPTISGGSSSGGGVTLKEIESIAPITAEVPYGTSALDALAALPAEITLNVKDGSEVKTTAAGRSWADGVCGSSQLRLHLRRRRFHFLLPQRKGRQEA